MNNTNGRTPPVAGPTEADREEERARLQRVRDAVERLHDRHHHAVA